MSLTKPLGRKNYGSIPHLSNSKLGDGDYYIGEGQERIMTVKKRDKHDELFVFEKYDGSNVGIAKVNDEIISLTRAGYLAESSPFKQHRLFAEWVNSRKEIFREILQENERITGEWLIQAHGLQYRIESEPIVFFDYFSSDNKRIIYEELIEKLSKYNLPRPRLLHRGNPITVNELLPILNQRTSTIYSLEPPEGMVFRVERKGKVDFLAKWVRADFEAGKFCINVPEENLIWNIKC